MVTYEYSAKLLFWATVLGLEIYPFRGIILGFVEFCFLYFLFVGFVFGGLRALGGVPSFHLRNFMSNAIEIMFGGSLGPEVWPFQTLVAPSLAIARTLALARSPLARSLFARGERRRGAERKAQLSADPARRPPGPEGSEGSGRRVYIWDHYHC